MVMMSSTLKGRVLKFTSPALEPKTVEVMSLDGREAISTPFRFDVELLSRKVDLDSAAVLKSPALVAIKQGVPISGARRGIRTLRVHGMVSSFEQCDQGMGWVLYRAALVPRLWRLSLTFQSRVFLDRTLPQIVEDVLKAGGFGPDDYELRLTGSYPKREYVVQYQESDLNFLSRLLEHDGVFYFFEHGEESEKVVFGDAPSAFQPVAAPSGFAYRPVGPGPEATWDWFGEETVRSWTMRHQPVPTKVVVKDYNYRTPSVDLKSEAEVSAVGEGTFYEYGDHYKDQGDGRRYARTRAEELKTREKIFTAIGDVRSFHAGATFDLSGHYRPDFNASYLITEVRHKTKQSVELAGAGTKATASYENEALCIPADVVYRPARVTPKPKIVGTMHAKVDASGDGKYAEVDDEGRYKVVLPFDLSGREGGKASRYIRMAQPYTGPNYGFHFPLHKKSEVILTHIDGDPDRPIIASAVPNPETSSPVKGGNQSQAIFRTAGGNQLVIEDSEGGENMTLYSPHAGTKLSMGGPGSGFGAETAADWIEKIGVNKTMDVGANLSASVAGSWLQKVDGFLEEKVGGGVMKTFNGDYQKFIAGASTEQVMGAKSGTVVGVKHDTIVGGEIKLCASFKVDKNAVKKVTTAGPYSLDATLIKMFATGSANFGAAGMTAVGSHSFLTLDAPDIAMNGGKVTVVGGPIVIRGGPVTIQSGSITLDGDVTITKSLTVKGTVTGEGNMALKGKIDVNKDATYQAMMKIAKKLQAGGGAFEAG